MVAEPEIIQRVIDVYEEAAEANRRTAALQGCVVHLTDDDGDEVLVSADLHGHRLNFNQLRRIADLAAHPRRHWLVQEVCHGGPSYPLTAACMSHLLLEDIALLKTQFPERFHFLLGNHELAELNDHLITKSGQVLNLCFRAGLQEMYGDDSQRVRDAAMRFLQTCPVAMRLDSGVFVCHGCPNLVAENGFDADFFSRALTPEDMVIDTDVFRLVWGRDFRQENAEAFAKCVGARVLIHGHEPCPEGFAVPNNLQIILDCCRTKACYVMLPVSGDLSHEEVVDRIRYVFGDECSSGTISWQEEDSPVPGESKTSN